MATAASPILQSEDLNVLPLDPRYTHPIKPAALAAIDGPLLERTWTDHPAIDWIGRWDGSKTARWAGSSLRFRFDGPLLFLIPGPKTLATEYPMIGWQIEGKTYTSHARKGRSIRLWPPDGVAHDALPITPSVDDGNNNSASAESTSMAATGSASSATPSRPTLTGSRQSTSTNLNLSLSNNLHVDDNDRELYDQPTPTASTFAQTSTSAARSTSATPTSSASTSSATSRLIEITLIDWGSTFQVNHFEMLSGSTITPAYSTGKSNLPTLLFIGDSLTSGYLDDTASLIAAKRRNNKSDEQDEYTGFLDAFPSQLRNYLAPGIRVYSIAFPGAALVDDSDVDVDIERRRPQQLRIGGRERDNGMESKFFKIGPLEPEEEEDNEWTFEDREDGNAPTHIFVNLGTNDTAPVETFLSTLENFLGLLKETYGRRTGDILVMAPFGQYTEDDQPTGEAGPSGSGAGISEEKARGSYKSTLSPHIKRKIEELSQEWALANEDPFASGDFPDTPVLEYTRAQLELGQEGLNSPSMKEGIRSRTNSRPNSASFANALSLSQQQALASASGVPNLNLVKSASMASIASTSAAGHATRPALIVRPSSIAAAVAPDQEKGTKTRLHFIDTTGWLETEEDTFDGLHPTPRGARKVAKKLKNWLGQNGFLAEA